LGARVRSLLLAEDAEGVGEEAQRKRFEGQRRRGADLRAVGPEEIDLALRGRLAQIDHSQIGEVAMSEVVAEAE